ncbi:hypothetical protein [Clostridium polynesiense]|uniref:hypothetical protein n=1 Tax=Clostridium polynesiense TaxID=1325933 RepID=UPI00058AD0B2|nr:hypothetical protein [Clostridium polynesiense]
MKDKEYIKSEKDFYGKVFVDINYAIDNIKPFIDGETLNQRKYYIKLPVLDRYISLLEASEQKAKTSGILSFFKKDNSIELIKDYKAQNSENLNQLDNCSKCACLNCTLSCGFNSCLGCRRNSFIAECDHKVLNVTHHNNYTLNLTNDRTGSSERYSVLATLEDCSKDKQYIIIENLINPEEKFILYYYPGLSEDTYGEITDTEEFDYIAAAYESTNI